jgi:predicted metal-dependent hydrolase
MRSSVAHAVPTIELGPHRIDYTVVRGRSRRNTYFRFRSDGMLEIIVPRGRGVNLNEAIQSRRSWIVRHHVESVTSTRVFDGDTVLFDGASLSIVFEKDHETEELRPEPSLGQVLVRAGDRSRTKELVRRWFLKETSGYAVKRAAELAAQMGLKYNTVDVRQVKSWGYCTKSRRLSFSWQLIALPQRLRDYVILHELTHLIEFNHSSAFDRRLAVMCPDYRQRERELSRIRPM